MSLKTKRTRNAWTAAAACVLLFSHGLYAAPAGNEGRTVLKGFAPHSEVSYTLRSAKEQLAQGSGTADADGHFVISEPGTISAAALPVSYDIGISEPGAPDPLHVTLTMQGGDGGLSLKADGLGQFARIETKGPASGAGETRGDWAGILEKDKAGVLDDVVATEGFEIAFLDGNINDGVSGKDPRIILVQLGGLDCSNSQNPPSLCRDPQLDHMNEETQMYITDSMRRASQQLTAVMMQSTAIFGKFLDAKMQLETQALFQRLTARAHKDYQPSEQMCQFGSFVRSVAKAEEKSELQKAALNRGLMVDYTNHSDSSTAFSEELDQVSRVDQFRKYYCNPQDNNGEVAKFCAHVTSASGDARYNRDLDFANLVGSPLTLNVDFLSPVAGVEQDTEEDVLALGRNLYWPNGLDPARKDVDFKDLSKRRHMAAMMNVAHSSYANLVGLKAKETPAATGVTGGAAFMKSLLREFGLSDENINRMLGENPGYYAQMEVLAKKIYQSPDFYTNLYDKPVNVDRIGASMDAIKLMQTRDMYETALRREMLTSMMVEEALSSGTSRADSTKPGHAGPEESARPSH